MSNQQFEHLALKWHLRATSGFSIVTSSSDIVTEIVNEISRTTPSCRVSPWGPQGYWVDKLGGRDKHCAEETRLFLIRTGWEPVGDHTSDTERECTFRYPITPTAAHAERVPDIADQLEKLVNLHNSGAISTTEFDAAKRKLLGT